MTAPREPALFRRDRHATPVGDGRFTLALNDRWNTLIGTVNGGLLLATVADAAAQITPDQPDPATMTAHFLRPAMPGPAELSTEVLHRGRRFSRLRAELRQDGRLLVTALMAMTDLTATSGPSMVQRPWAPLPAPETCLDPLAVGDPALMPSLEHRFERRLPEESTRWARGAPSGTGSLASWSRLAGDEPWDVPGLLLLADSSAPAVFDLGIPFTGVPTVELTVQVRSRPPADGWLALRASTTAVTAGLLEEDAEVRTPDGRLLALARQLAVLV